MPVETTVGFDVGAIIAIEGGGNSETGVIASFGSIVLTTGLTNSYPANSTVTLYVTTTFTSSVTLSTTVSTTSKISSTRTTGSSTTVTTVTSVYDVWTQGKCDRWIYYIDGCTLAANELNLSTVEAVDDGQSGGWTDPPYCYIENSVLKFNSDGTNRGLCSQSDQCICASLSPTYTATSETSTTRTVPIPPTRSPTFMPTPIPTVPCFDVDVTENVTESHLWHDSTGTEFNCDWYAAMGCPSDASLYSNFGHSAQQACCVCGGGQAEPSEKVSLGVTVQGVSFDLLSQDQEAKDAIESSIKAVVATAAGVDIDDVEVEFFEGS